MNTHEQLREDWSKISDNFIIGGVNEGGFDENYIDEQGIADFWLSKLDAYTDARLNEWKEKVFGSEWKEIKENFMQTIEKYPNLTSGIIDSAYLHGIETSDAKLAKVAEEIERHIYFIEEGIEACKYDSSQEDCVGGELQYIFGKSQALKIIKQRLLDSASLVREAMSKK